MKERRLARRMATAQSELWALSLADLMSLLFSFFVLLTTLSTQPKDCNAIARYFEQNRAMFKNFELRNSKIECVITLPSDFLFQTGEDQVQQAALSRLEPLFKTIKELKEHREDLIVVEGHTDDVPIKTVRFPSNWELSSARSTNVANFLRKVGMPASQISIRAFADQRPRVPYRNQFGETLRGKELQEARARNRRVDIFLVNPPSAIEEYALLFR